MNGTDDAANLATTFAVLKPAMSIDCLPVTPSLYADLDSRYDGFAGHALIACHSFEDDWPTWEVHPRGDELVCLLSGDSELIMRTDAGDRSVRLDEPGSFFVVPANTWHTAKVHAPTTMLFVTSGEGTENRESPP